MCGAVDQAGNLGFHDGGLAGGAGFTAVAVHGIDGQKSTFKAQHCAIAGIETRSFGLNRPSQDTRHILMNQLNLRWLERV